MSHIDRLRGYYVRSPRWVQASAGRALSMAPPRLLYGKTFWRWRADIERSELDAAFVERRLASGMTAVLDAAAATEHYAAALGAHGLVPPTLQGLESLPTLSKEQVRQDVERMLAVPSESLDEVTTGGTSSMVPLTFYLDRDRSVKEWAFLTHLWGRIGYRPGDRLGVLGYRGVTHLPGAASRPWAWEPGTRELRLSPFRMVPPVMDDYLRLIEHYRVAYMYAYPSAITLLAAHARARRWTPPRTLRGILLMSEALHPHQREVLAEGFPGSPVLCGYGLSEKVAIAGELVGRPDVYEFEPLYGYAELVDDEGCVIREPGRRGRLIGTGFISIGMPMIRYDTGDLATLVRAPSRADCWRLRVRDITSRHSQDYLVTSEGGLIAHTVVYPHNRVVRECQFVQEERGVALLRLVPEPGTRREELDDIVRVVHARADGLLKVELDVVEEIPGTGRGKKPVVVQRLDLTGFGLD